MCKLVRASWKSSGGGNAFGFGGESGSHRISRPGGSCGLSSVSLGGEDNAGGKALCLRSGFSGAGSVGGSASGGESDAARAVCCSSMTGCDDASRLYTLDGGRSCSVLPTLDSFGGFVRASDGGLSREVGLPEALRTVLASWDVLRMSVGVELAILHVGLSSADFVGPFQFTFPRLSPLIIMGRDRLAALRVKI